MKLQFETYMPSEAEAITGVTQVTVRNWRRAGHLPKRQGHARYNLPDLLVMFVMGQLVSRGTAPEACKEFAGTAASAIFQSAVYSWKTFGSDVLDEAAVEVGEIPESDIAPLREECGERFTVETLKDVRRIELLAREAEKMTGQSGMKRPDWLIIWADGALEFIYSSDDPDDAFFGNIQHGQAYVQGPVMMFCLGALAQMVIDRLPRPAIRLAEGAK